MTIESFFTQNTQNVFPTNGNSRVAGAPSPETGLAFLDLMFSTLLKNGTDTEGKASRKNEDREVLQSGNPLLDKNPEIDIAKLIAANPDVQRKIADFIQATSPGGEDEITDGITQALVLNQQVFDQILKPLIIEKLSTLEAVEGLSEIQISDLLNLESEEIASLSFEDIIIGSEGGISKDVLQAVLNKVKTLSESGQITTSNLTPGQITQIENASEVGESGIVGFEGNGKAPNVVMIELIKTLLPAAQLGLFPPPPAQNRQAGRIEQIRTAPGAGTNAQGEDIINFGQIMKGLTGKTQDKVLGDAKSATNADFKPGIQNTVLQTSASLPSVTSGLGFENGFFLTPSEWAAGLLERFGVSGLNAPITGLNNLTNPVTQAQSATQSPPGTQLVAATMQRAGLNGENRSITLQLDPPELGRVEVRMNFGKNKSVRAVLTIEKPETMAMLQRDAHTLEKAMGDIGLDSDGGINFELAGEDHGFNQNGSHDGSEGGRGGSSSGEDDLEIIQSTMTWQIDPETGHVRYDIWA